MTSLSASYTPVLAAVLARLYAVALVGIKRPPAGEVPPSPLRLAEAGAFDLPGA